MKTMKYEKYYMSMCLMPNRKAFRDFKSGFILPDKGINANSSVHSLLMCENEKRSCISVTTFRGFFLLWRLWLLITWQHGVNITDPVPCEKISECFYGQSLPLTELHQRVFFILLNDPDKKVALYQTICALEMNWIRMLGRNSQCLKCRFLIFCTCSEMKANKNGEEEELFFCVN